eukprot:TRINITY_DN9187_c0_g1_i3.p1 TRINITY_DN9187_c0_g1~~TRINITY_DN9187_c0_g1_i3.p1  ORF type:complete len:331 (-),score=60.17 TRINITY_DN9187_c0_g1_i3:195-1187(-)
MQLLMTPNLGLWEQQTALFSCVCQEMCGHRVTPETLLALLHPFVRTQTKQVVHSVLLILQPLVFTTQCPVSCLLDSSSKEAPCFLDSLLNVVHGAQKEPRTLQCAVRILLSITAECGCEERMAFGPLIESGSLAALVCCDSVEISSMSIQIVTHLLQNEKLSSKIWQASPESLPHRSINAAQKAICSMQLPQRAQMPGLRGVALQLISSVVNQDGGIDNLLGVRHASRSPNNSEFGDREGGHLEHSQLVPTLVYWLYSEASGEEQTIGISRVQRLIGIFVAVKRRITLKPLLHPVRHIFTWAIKRLKQVQQKVQPNISDLDIHQLRSILD